MRNRVCSQPVLAASTVSGLKTGHRPRVLSSLTPRSFVDSICRPSVSRSALPLAVPTPKHPASHHMDLTPRDIQIVDLVFRMRALQDRHIQVALFSARRRISTAKEAHALGRQQVPIPTAPELRQ